MRHVLITGASSGLGSALARNYAGSGTRLTLCGRDHERLARTADACRARGSDADVLAFDVRDIDTCIASVRDSDSAIPIDIAIFNAGIGGPTPADRIVEPAERAREIATVNFTAAIVGATAAAEAMTHRQTGQIVLIGSIGESFPLPMAPTYSAAKAGLRVFAEALGLRVQRCGVKVTLVSPGFIDTPMSRQIAGPKPFMVTPDAAAAIIRAGVDRGAPRIVFPASFAIVRALFVGLPRRLRHAILVRLKS